MLAVLAPGAYAQSPASPAAAPAPSSGPFVTPPASASPSAAPAPQAVSATPPAKREISSGAAAMLARVAPAYSPPKPVAAKPDSGDTDDSTEDNDQPRNHIIRLPKFIVHEQQPPIFREKDLYDK